jgi:hypothetical protein
VAVGANGTVVSAKSATRPAWRVAQLPGAGAFAGVSCVSSTASLCVAVDGDGDVASSTHPLNGAGAWSVARVGSGSPLIAVSCPSLHLCVAIDAASDVLTSTDPAAGAAAVWVLSAHDLEATNTANSYIPSLTNLSCPSVSFCMAIDNGDGTFFTSAPTGSAWHFAWAEEAQGEDTPQLLGIACASTRFCALTDGYANISWTPDPAARAGDWRDGGGPGGNDTGIQQASRPLAAISCPSASLCVAVGYTTVVDPQPSSGAGERVSAADPHHTLTGVSCPSVQACVAVDDRGDAVLAA